MRRAFIAAALVLLPAAAFAQAVEGQPPLPATVTLQDVLKLFEERSPRARAERATVDVAAADRLTAGTLPNPTVSYGGTHLFSGLSTGAVTQHQVVVEQPLLIFHQRDARRSAADLNVHAEEARVAQALSDRRLQVRQAFAELLGRQERLAVIRTSVADLERVQTVVRGRTEAGERSRYELARIETETERLRIEMMNADTDIEDAAGRLAALLGFPGWSPRATGTIAASADVPTDFAPLWDAAQRRRPSLVALRQREAAARGGLFLARRERLPVPALSGGTQITRDVNGTSAFFGFSMPLLVFDHAQGPIARATAQLNAETLTLEAESAEVRAEIEHARLVLARRRDALQHLEQTVIGRVPGLRQMAEDAYREGSADILELLDAMRSQKDIALSHVEQLESAKLAEETVIAAAGLDAPNIP